MPFPSPGNLPHPEIKLTSLVSPARQEDSLPLSPLGSLGINFYFKEFFLMWMVLKVFIEFVTILLLFGVVDFFFAPTTRHLGSSFQSGIKSVLPALEGEVLTTGPPWKS